MKNFIEELKKTGNSRETETRMVLGGLGYKWKWKNIGQRVKIYSYNINKCVEQMCSMVIIANNNGIIYRNVDKNALTTKEKW